MPSRARGSARTLNGDAGRPGGRESGAAGSCQRPQAASKWRRSGATSALRQLLAAYHLEASECVSRSQLKGAYAVDVRPDHITAELTHYELGNLAAHLEAAGQETMLRWLLALETDAGTSFWFEAKDEGDPGRYAADVQRALRLVRRAVDAHILAGEPTPEVALELRYALLDRSTRSFGYETEVLLAMVQKGMRSAEQVLAHLSQMPLSIDTIAALAPHLPAQVRTRLLRDLLRDALDSISAADVDTQRLRTLSSIAPFLPAELMGEALSVIRAIGDETDRASALAALGPRLPASLRNEGVAVASSIREPSLRIAALTVLGIETSAVSLRAALAAEPGTDGDDRVDAAVMLAASLPPDLLGEVLAATGAFSRRMDEVLIALAPRLPNDLVLEAMAVTQTISKWDEPGGVLAALVPRLSGKALQRARRIAAQYLDEDRIRVLSELALRYPERARDRTLEAALRIAEREIAQDDYMSVELADAVVRLVELIPRSLLPRALALARNIRNSDARSALLVAVGARLTGPIQRKKVLRKALQEIRGIDDSDAERVLTRLAPLLPGEVLPFILDDLRPAEDDSGLNYLGTVAPHLQADELREALRAARRWKYSAAECATMARLARYTTEPDRSTLLRAALDVCRRIRHHREQASALEAIASLLPGDLAAEALNIAELIPHEAGARARAAVARAVPPPLVSRAAGAILVGYEGYRARAYAALAPKADDPIKTELLEQALAAVGMIDWDDRLAADVGLITQLAPDLPERLLDRALDKALDPLSRGDPGVRASALTALARRFEGAERSAIVREALAVAADAKSRVEALVGLGAEVPGVAEAIRQIDHAKWRAVGLAELGEPVPEEALRSPIGSPVNRYTVDAALRLLPFSSPDQIRALLAELRHSEEWADLVDGSWFARTLAAIVPRLDAELLPDLVDLAGSIPPHSRSDLLAAIVDTFWPFPSRWLHDCWLQARASIDTSGFWDLAALAPLVEAIGGPAAVADSAASVRLVARWFSPCAPTVAATTRGS